MQLACPSCAKTLEFSGERPRFCSFCGQALSTCEMPTLMPEPEGAAPTAEEAETVGLPAGAAGGSIPGTIGGYRLLRRLGGGGMGAVYEAEEAASGRRVALKLVLPEYAGSPETLVRFRQEGRLASTLVHPRCVFVLAADEEAGRPFIVMELMPGETLDDLVRQRGPLPVEEALAKIVDVIDGLQEAHERGLVHRDVKPSNCFLEKSGRVKVGDFGLARSLVADTKLTRTGAFVGTPLYAAPEQIHKNEPTDAQSDVYSVAATLYFLLTGRAPFQTGGDAVATLARIVTESPPRMRSFRRELPRGLDRVVLRGLERDRGRRWKDLEGLRRALLRFLPARSSGVGLGLRFAAYLIDSILIGAVSSSSGLVIRFAGSFATLSTPTLLGYGVAAIVHLAYFTLLEGLLGWSLGKRLLRVRVGIATGTSPPGIFRALIRTATLYFLINLGSYAAHLLLVLTGNFPVPGARLTYDQEVVFGLIGASSVLWYAFALGLILCTMRARNGYRGLHELLSGTRTYQLQWPRPRQRRALHARPYEHEVSHADGMPERIGAFDVRGALRWQEDERCLLAEDPRLGRRVWIWLRPTSQPPLDGTCRDIDRATRVRWIASGTHDDCQWDAFLAPSGMPLPLLTAGRGGLSWGDARQILENLAEELDASCAEGSLPASLAAHQVWVQPDGRVQLLGTPLTRSTAAVSRLTVPDARTAGADEERALQFLREVAVTALEGSARSIAAAGDSVHAPVPVHAEKILERLVGSSQRYTRLGEVRQDLEAVRDRPAEITRPRRAGHLAFASLLLHAPFGGPLLIAFYSLLGPLCTAYFGTPLGDNAVAYIFIVLNLTFWAVWSFAFRGGYSYWRGGIVLRRADGRKAARWQCLVRTLVIWVPVAGLYALACVMASLFPQWPAIYFGLWSLATLLLPSYIVVALLYPTRSVHDWIAGTYLMPQ
jgi:hypothetical protein